MIKADLNLRMIRFCMDYTQKRFCNMRAVGLYTGHGVAMRAVGLYTGHGVAVRAVGLHTGHGVALRAVGLYTGHGVAVDSFHQHRCRPRVQIPVLAVDNMVVDTNYQTGKTYGMGN